MKKIQRCCQIQLFFIRGKNKIFRKGGNHRVFIRVYVQHDPVLGSKSKLG